MLAVSVLLTVAGLFVSLPAWSVWVPAGLSALAAVSGCAVAGRAARRSPARRFWRGLGVAAAFMTTGAFSQAYDSATVTGESLPVRLPTMLLYLAAVGTAVSALFRVPGRRQSWRVRFTMTVDVAIVAVAAGIAASQFVRSSRLLVPDSPVLAALNLIVLATACAAVVAVIRVGLTGHGPVDRSALWWLTPIGIVSPLTMALIPLLRPWPHLNASALTMPVIGLLFVLAARAQLTGDTRSVATGVAEPADGTAVSWWRVLWRSVSVVPYAAILVTAALLTVVALRTGHLQAGAVVGSVVLTLLVLVRQLVALFDNTMLMDRLAYQVNHDELTGLANRRLFASLLADHDGPLTVTVLGLDRFAAINDSLGTATGDQVLTAAGERLRHMAGAAAVVARLGGDEFGVLLPADTDTDTDSAAELAAVFDEPLQVDGHDLLVSATAGYATGADGDVPDLLRRAELALHLGKQRRTSRAVRYDASLETVAERDATLAAQIRHGLRAGEFRVLYQPIVTLPAGRLVAVEALVRWQRADGATVSPAQFIPIAERTGQIIDLGAWIFETACAQAAVWRRRHGAAAPLVSVNVSARQLLDPTLPAQVAEVLHRHELPADAITVEITETAVFGGGAALDTLHALREIGVVLALDDFGTGHSSLSLLRTCPVDVLKVDKSFVDGVAGSAQQEAVAAALISIADTLGLRTVAEGVETARQAERLHELGYRYAQGFHFARPQPATDIDALLQQRAGAIAS